MFDLHLKHWPKAVRRHLAVPETTVDYNLTVNANRYPNRTAVIYYDGQVSYRQLDDQVNALAGYLQKTLGVKKNDRVLLYMQNSPQFIIGFYAILRAGGVVIPANPMNRVAEMEHLAKDTSARVALAGQELVSQLLPLMENGALSSVVSAAYSDYIDNSFDLPLPEVVKAPVQDFAGSEGVVLWADVLAADEMPEDTGVGPDDWAVFPYSSGTTGAPKGCVHTHRTVMTTALGGINWILMVAGETNLISLPMFHVTGMQNSLNGPLYAGATMVVMTRWDRTIAARLIERYGVSRWVAISTMVIDLLNDPDLEKYDLSSLARVSGGGAAMPEAVAQRLADMTGQQYIEGYGLSETMAATHINPTDRPKKQCLGIPVFDVDCRIVSVEDDRLLGANEHGEIIMNAPQVFKGYWNNEQATKEAFVTVEGKEFFRTGDIGYYDEEGYFFIVDRVKRMINAAGFKIWPAEVEAIMHAHPALSEVAIIGKPDTRAGEVVKACVTLRHGVEEDVTPEGIMAWCHENMAAYKCPREVVIMEELPKSATGKVEWRRLQELERA